MENRLYQILVNIKIMWERYQCSLFQKSQIKRFFDSTLRNTKTWTLSSGAFSDTASKTQHTVERSRPKTKQCFCPGIWLGPGEVSVR